MQTLQSEKKKHYELFCVSRKSEKLSGNVNRRDSNEIKQQKQITTVQQINNNYTVIFREKKRFEVELAIFH